MSNTTEESGALLPDGSLSANLLKALDVLVTQAVERSMASTNQSLESLSREMTDMRSQMSNIRSDVTDVRSGMSGMLSDMTNMRSEMSNMLSDITGMRSNMSDLSREMRSLKDGQERQEFRLSAIESYPRVAISQPPRLYGTQAQSVSSPKRVRTGYAG